jgi:hypothetical protein
MNGMIQLQSRIKIEDDISQRIIKLKTPKNKFFKQLLLFILNYNYLELEPENTS